MFCRISEDSLNGPGSLPARLKALPAFAPPPGGWSQLNARMQARRRRVVAISTGFALAASVVVAISVVLVKPVHAPGTAAPQAVATAASNTTVAQLIDRSQQLERELASARPQVVVWNSGRETRTALIEQRLRLVDAQLNYADPESAERLWRDRVTLMKSLVALHQPQEPALMKASYQY
jgi:hypothetical protein